MNGFILVRGGNGVGGNVGGGSGGSIFIKIINMIGYGEIVVIGGFVYNYGVGGGGFGGRVGIYCWWRYIYGGKFIDCGGFGV